MQMHREVFNLQLSGELSGSALLLYQYLGFHCDARRRYGTGRIHVEVTVAFVAQELSLHRSTIRRASKRLQSLGLLQCDGISCVSGILPHMAAPPAPEKPEQESASPERRVTKATEDSVVAQAETAAKLRKEAQMQHEENRRLEEERAHRNGNFDTDAYLRSQGLR